MNGTNLRRTRGIGPSFSLHSFHEMSSVAHIFEIHACYASLWGYEILSGNACYDSLCYVIVFISLVVEKESLSFRMVL